MLDATTLPFLKNGKNLLAFSAGSDSTALFHLLLRAGISFDIAHVNYHTRAQCAREAARARQLAQTHGLQCHTFDAPPIEKNFEAEARTIRYRFFETVIETHGYDTLLTAHQLDDRLEWFLMQMCRGAGLPELLGMQPVSHREGYTLLRPLLTVEKAALRQWLEDEGIAWFEDESNEDQQYERNRFRHRYARPLLDESAGGIRRTFSYLETDQYYLPEEPHAETLPDGVLFVPRPFERSALIRLVDRWLKCVGVLMPGGERNRLMKEDEVIVARRYAVGIAQSGCIVAPVEKATLPGDFRESCRLSGIAPSVRAYLFKHPKAFSALMEYLQQRKNRKT